MSGDTMRGVWLEEGHVLLRRDLPLPDPPDGEALVRVVRAGICNTDLELIKGYYPYRGVLGHEFVGEVESGPAALRGERVVGEINAVCGACVACQTGRPTHCTDRTVLGIVNRHGAFADYLTLPVQNLHVVPPTVSTDAATFVEPLAAALEIQEQVRVGPEDHVLIVGDGKLGMLVAQTMALTGAHLVISGRHPDRLARLGGHGLTAVSPNAIESGAYDLVVECTGNPVGFRIALNAVRPRGTLIMKSTYAGDLTLDAATVVVNEITLVGSRCGPFAPALRHLAEGRVDVESLIDARYSLDDAEAAIEHASRSGVLKVVLETGADA